MNDFTAVRIRFTTDPVTCKANINEYEYKKGRWMEKNGRGLHFLDWKPDSYHESRWGRDQTSFTHSYSTNVDDGRLWEGHAVQHRVLVIQLEKMQELLFNTCATVAPHTSAVSYPYARTHTGYTHPSLLWVSRSPFLPQSLNCRRGDPSGKANNGRVELVKPRGGGFGGVVWDDPLLS